MATAAEATRILWGRDGAYHHHHHRRRRHYSPIITALRLKYKCGIRCSHPVTLFAGCISETIQDGNIVIREDCQDLNTCHTTKDCVVLAWLAQSKITTFAFGFDAAIRLSLV